MKTFSTLLIIFTCTCSSAQSDSIKSNGEFRYGLQFGGSYNTLVGGALINPLITQSNNKHQFEFGPKFHTGAWSPQGTRFGAEFNYKFFPNTNTSRFSSFLLVNTELYYEKGSVSYRDYNAIPSQVVDVTHSWLSRTAAWHMGYGIEWNFWSQFYCTTDISAGGFHVVYNGERVYSEPSLNSTWGSAYYGLSVRTSVSIGWRFK